ncbi:CBS domain-containing protein [Cystobacter fuscus]|uniref:CBS domain-containing protein n=1 Tax=Cystobacter fuscus TaxID=43 RepID=UPI002B2FCFC7|nr:CBS domain-containing protein [Cystobacter fuscus]
MKTLKDVMTREEEVLEPRATLRRAAELMRRLDADSLPVCEHGKLVGLVTNRDLVVRGVAMGHDVDASRVSSVMSEDVEGLSPDTPVEEAMRRMEDSSLDGLWVVDEGRHLLGHVSRSVLFPDVPHAPTPRELEEFFGSGASWH